MSTRGKVVFTSGQDFVCFFLVVENFATIGMQSGIGPLQAAKPGYWRQCRVFSWGMVLEIQLDENLAWEVLYAELKRQKDAGKPAPIKLLDPALYELVLLPERRSIFIDGKCIKFSKNKFIVVEILINKAPRLVRHEKIYCALFDSMSEGPGMRYLYELIWKIRNDISDTKLKILSENRRGLRLIRTNDA